MKMVSSIFKLIFGVRMIKILTSSGYKGLMYEIDDLKRRNADLRKGIIPGYVEAIQRLENRLYAQDLLLGILKSQFSDIEYRKYVGQRDTLLQIRCETQKE